MFNDFVSVAERGFARLRTRAGALIAGRDFEEKSCVEIHGWVNLVARERGKKVTSRQGHNVWTNTGREYLAMLISIANTLPSLSYYRSDRIALLGVGTGSQPETPGVTSLVNPIPYSGDHFLTDLDLPDFPLYPTRTTVRFSKTFLENDITLGAGRINISEMGLFTNGDPTSVPPFQSPVDGPGLGRSKLMSVAGAQAPMAYKTFEPIGKTNSMQLEVSWEIRF